MDLVLNLISQKSKLCQQFLYDVKTYFFVKKIAVTVNHFGYFNALQVLESKKNLISIL